MKKRGLAGILLIALLASMTITGCSSKLLWIGNSGSDHIKANYKLFSGTEKKKISVNEGDTLVIDYVSDVNEGSLTLTLTDPEGNEAATLTADTEGTERIGITESGRYTLWIKGKKTGGSFEINWSIE